jgi:L-ascorbate oxidase
LVNPRPDGKSRRLLGLVRVQDGTPVQGDLQTYIQSRLVAANPGMPGDVAQQITAGSLEAFAPNENLPQDKVVRTRQVNFNVVLATGNPPRFEVNDAIYNPNRVDFRANLGTIEDWDATSGIGNHVFHIHVNPFQIIDIKGPNGTIFGPNGCTEPANDREYCDLKGVFRDTMFVRSGYHVVLRTAYVRYIGEYVMHCHILDHEDQGMMLNVEVVPEGDNPDQSGRLPVPGGTGHGSH